MASAIVFSPYIFSATADGKLPATVVLSDCDSRMHWSEPSVGMDKAVKLENSKTSDGSAYFALSDKYRNLNLVYMPAEAIDALENDGMSFSLYIEKADSVRDVGLTVTVSSAGLAVVDKAGWSTGLSKLSLKSGWNEISFKFSDSSASGRLDRSAVNYLSLYFTGMSGIAGICVDNIRFTNSGGNAPANPQTGYTAGAGLVINDEKIVYGDVNGEGISASDALIVLQNAVGKYELESDLMTLSDVNFDGKITASDALLILQRSVGKISGFARDGIIKHGDYMSKINIEGTRLVTPFYGSKTPVVAVADVIYFGAVGDGVADDTAAFRKALNFASRLGGGTVFVPVGKYKITGSLVIPDGVTLRGDAPDVPDTGEVLGTVIYSYVGMDDEDGLSLFRINAGSAVKNMAVYYPEQKADNIRPCSYTFKEEDQYGPTIESILLVNSYNGICFGPRVNALQTVRNVYGTVLKNGYYIDYNVDICRVENVGFSPDYWIKSGLDSVDEAALRSFVKENCIAFLVENVDWTYMNDISVDGAYIAYKTGFSSRRDGGGSCNGEMYNFRFENCEYGYYGEYVNDIGHMFTNGTVIARVPVCMADTFTTSATFNNVLLQSTGDSAVMLSKGSMSFTDCSFSSKAETLASGTVSLNGPGNLSLVNCTFEGEGSCIFATPDATVKTVNCMTFDALTIRGDKTRVQQFFGEYKTETVNTDSYDYDRRIRTQPLGSAFLDLGSASYGISEYAAGDISALVQQAIDEVYELGGGVVYIPAGKYYLDSPITVSHGVELCGSSDVSRHSHVPATTLYTTYGRDYSPEEKALITVEGNGGISGFNVMYADQKADSDKEDGVYKYGYTVRATGYNARIINVLLINSYYGIDLFSNRCDYHFVMGVTGMPLKNGIKTGGGSRGGVVRDTQLNVPYFMDNPLYSLGNNTSKTSAYGKKFVEGITLGTTENEIFYNNFLLGSYAGLVIEGSPENAFVLAHGTDASNYSCYIRSDSDKTVKLVNSQFVTSGGSSMEYVYVEDFSRGDISFINTNFWGTPTNLTYQGSADLRFYSGTILRAGKNGMQVMGGTLVKAGIISRQTDVSSDIYIGDRAQWAVSFGNLYARPIKVYDKNGRLSGSDIDTPSIPSGSVHDVVFSNCDSAHGWQTGESVGAIVELDTGEKTEGAASVKTVNDIKSTRTLSMILKLENGVDAGYNDLFTFDVYIEDPSLFIGSAGQIELSSSGMSDVGEVSWYPAEMVTKDFKAGWNTVSFSFLKAKSVTPSGEKGFDKSDINYFRFFVANISSDKSDYILRIDNMRFTSSSTK